MAREKSVIPIERIAAQIYVIRGESIMLDADLAELYHVETGALVRAMKRNLDRFPEDFAFQLNQGRVRQLEKPNWHLKLGWATLRTLCIHGARRGDALRHPS